MPGFMPPSATIWLKAFSNTRGTEGMHVGCTSEALARIFSTDSAKAMADMPGSTRSPRRRGRRRARAEGTAARDRSAEHRGLHHRVRLGDPVGMGEHHALGRASGSRGVEDAVEIVRGDPAGALLERTRAVRQRRAPLLLEIGEREQALVRPRGHLEAHVALDRARARAQLPKPRPPAGARPLGPVVVEDHHLGLAVADDVLGLLGGVGGVDGHGHRAGAERGEVGEAPLQPRRRVEADPVALLHSECDEPLAERAHPREHLAPAHALPLAVDLLLGRLALGVPGVAQEHPDEVLRVGADRDVERASFHQSTPSRRGVRRV